jgi:ADP-ribose pyrophosphatase YjhB (NUDIX family)
MKLAAVTILESIPGRFLALHHFNKSECAWRFSGGKLNNCESPAQAAIRELKEEVGVAATELRFVCCMVAYLDGEDWCCYFFEALKWVGNPYIKERQKFDKMSFLTMPELYSLGSWNVADVLAWKQGIKPVGPGIIQSPYIVTSIQARILDELRCPLLSVGQIAARLELFEEVVKYELRKLRNSLQVKDNESLIAWWKKNRVVFNFNIGDQRRSARCQ